MEAGPDETGSTVRVLLLKDAPEQGADDPYHAALAARLAGPGSALQLDYQALQHVAYDDDATAAALSAALLEDPPCDSVVVTSHRACVGLGRALPLLEPEPEQRWGAVQRAFVVGAHTAAEAEARLRLPSVPAGGAPRAAALLPTIAAAAAEGGTRALLRAQVAGRADSLAPQLRAVSDDPALAVREVAAYRMAPVPTAELEQTFRQLGTEPDQSPCWVVVFSPLRLQELSEVMGASLQESSRQVRWAAIGPTSASAMEAAGLEVHAVAAAPSAEGVADAIAAARADGRGA